MPPGYHKEWHVGVRVRSTKKLVAFISGIPTTLVVRNKYCTALSNYKRVTYRFYAEMSK